MITRVPPGTWETRRLHRARRLEIPPTNSRLIDGSASWAGGTKMDATMVSPSELNGARRIGRQGVAGPQIPLKRGNPSRGTPSRAGGAVA